MTDFAPSPSALLTGRAAPFARPPAPTEATPLKGEASSSSPSSWGRQCFDIGPSASYEVSGKWHAFFNEMMCLVGIGSLTLPYATAQVGLTISLLGLGLLSYISWEGIRFLAYCAAHLREERAHDIESGSAGEPAAAAKAAAALSTRDRGAWHLISTHAFGQAGWICTMTSLTVAQIGVATAYVAYVEGTLRYAMHTDLRSTLLLLWLVFSLLSLLLNPGMRSIAWLSGFALTVMVYIYILIVYFACQTHVNELPALIQFNLTNIGLWYGPALFSFEGMGSALSIYDSMGSVDPKPFVDVISWSYIVSCLLYATVIVAGYVGWGPNVNRMIILNFPKSPLGQSASYILAAALTCSYVLQMTPIFQMVEDALPQHLDRTWAALRMALVGLTILIAFAVPSVEKICSLTGAVAFSTLCFVLPGAYFLKINPKGLPPSPRGAYHKIVALILLPPGLRVGL